MSMPPPDAPSPASLFAALYAQAAAWTPSERMTAEMPEAMFAGVCATILRSNDGSEAHDQVRSLIEDKHCTVRAHRGRVLAALRAIDLAFYEIHPRTFDDLAALPEWLRDLRLRRAQHGAYWEDEHHRLIPRGPLLRAPRSPGAASGDLIADRFAALSVVAIRLEHDGRPIAITMTVKGSDAATGVPRSTRNSETVGFAALAAQIGQLEAKPIHRPAMFASYGPSPAFDAGQAAIEAVRAFGDIDLAIMPELALTSEHVDTLCTTLETEAWPRPRIIVAGSYHAPSGDDQPWNECRVINADGTTLWTQRKIWPASVTRERAIQYGLPDPGHGVSVTEDNRAGSELIVADIDTFGRCVILICQDLEAPIFAQSLITHYQPDWIITPIFDCSIDTGRWAHARAFGLSHLSQARFVAVTNMAFAGSGVVPGMGMAVGPKESVEEDDGDRVFQLVKRPDHPALPLAVVTWREGDWSQTILGTYEPGPMT